jgi:hypothetical protein
MDLAGLGFGSFVPPAVQEAYSQCALSSDTSAHGSAATSKNAAAVAAQQMTWACVPTTRRQKHILIPDHR